MISIVSGKHLPHVTRSYTMTTRLTKIDAPAPRRMTAAWLVHQLTTSGRAAAALHRRNYLTTRSSTEIVIRPISAEDARQEAELAAACRSVKLLCRIVEDALADTSGESVQTRTAAGYVCTVRAGGGWEVVYSADDDAVREDLYDDTVRAFADRAVADVYHAQLVERFASTDTEASDVPAVVEEMGDRVDDVTGRRQVVPVLFAMAAAWTAFAAGQQVAHPVYRPTPEQAQAARAAWHREGAVLAAEDGFEGRVSAPAGTPRAARPFQGAI